MTFLLQEDSKRAKVLHRTIYCCCHGPEDNSKNIPAEGEAQPRPEGSRRKMTEWGGGTKIGCQASFKAVIYIAEPKTVEIQYVHRAHTNTVGLPCHDENSQQPGRFLSGSARQKVKVTHH